MSHIFKLRRKHKAPSQPSPVPTTASSEPHIYSSARSSKKSFPAGVKVWYEPGDTAVVDIIFVHGLTGDRDRTWTAKGEARPWPQTLLPSEIQQSRILTFGYDAYVADLHSVVSQNRVGDHAKNLLAALVTHREQDHTRPIIFVTHSLGGLVTKDALLVSRNCPERHRRSMFECTRAIVFLGTPHTGSSLAPWAEGLAKAIGLIKQANVRALQTLNTNSEVLQRIQSDFDTMLRTRVSQDRPIDITCFYEELPVAGIGKIVSTQSATISSYPLIGIHSNHMDMARFRSREDPGFVSVVGELIRLVRVIEQDQNTSLTKGSILRSSSVSGTVITPVVSRPAFMVPYDRDRRFIGREDIITRIDKALEHHQRVALAGIGGIGKSQIAIEYAYRYRDQHPESHVFWIYAADTATFDKAYQELARKLKIPGWDTPGADIRTLVFEWLSDEVNGCWLMILDNADEARLFFSKGSSADFPQSSLAAYLPLETNKNGTLLVTTRDRGLGLDLTDQLKPIAVESFSPKDAMELLRSKANWEDHESAETEKLLETLGYIPLAITQAAAFMRHYSMSLKDYAALILKEETTLTDFLEEELQDSRRQKGSPNSIFRTWKLSFERLARENRRAADMLSLVVHLDREGIPKALLRDEDEREIQFFTAIGELQGLSLVTAETGGETLTVHRLVQLSVQSWLRLENKDVVFQAEVLKRVSEAFPHARFENWDKCRALHTHAEVVLGYDLVSDESLLHQGELLSRIAWYNLQQGRHAVAEKLCRRALEVRTNVLSPRDPIMLQDHMRLAVVLLNSHQNNLEEAEQRSRWAMESLIDTLGPEDSYTLMSMRHLAGALRLQGNYKEAEELYRRVLETQDKIFGPEDANTLMAMSDLAMVLQAQDKYEVAEQLCRRALEGQEKVLALEHPDTLSSLSHLGNLLHCQGKYEAAEEMCRRALEAQEKILAPDHVDTLWSVGTLAEILDNQGRYEEACSLYRRALTGFEKTLGADNAQTIGCAENLNELLARMDGEQAAEDTSDDIVSDLEDDS